MKECPYCGQYITSGNPETQPFFTTDSARLAAEVCENLIVALKRGGSVRDGRKPHELVVAGSNPALASNCYEEPLRRREGQGSQARLKALGLSLELKGEAKGRSSRAWLRNRVHRQHRGFESHPWHHYRGYPRYPRGNIVSAVHWYKNQRLNVQKTSDLRQSFQKRSFKQVSLTAEILRSISLRLTAVIVCALGCTSRHGVDIL